MKLSVKFVVSLAVSLVFLGYVFSQVNINQVWQILQSARIEVLVIGVGMVGILPLLGGLRWWAVQSVFVKKPSLGKSIETVQMAFVLNTILPAKLGDATKALSVSSKKDGLLGVVVERLIDLLLLGILAVVGGVWAGQEFSFK